MMGRENEDKYRRIEFFGLPGAGKSTLANLLVADRQWNSNLWTHRKAVIQCLLRRDDGLLRNLLKKFPYEIWEPISGTRNALSEFHEFSVENVAFLRLIFEAIDTGVMCSAWKSCILYVFFSLGVEHQLFSNFLQRDESVVLEEGFAQGILSAFGYRSPMNVDRDEIDEYIARIPFLTGVICVDTPPQICFERLCQRSKLPLILSEEKQVNRIKRIEYLDQCMRIAMESFERHGVSLYHVSHGNGSPKNIAYNIRNACQSWL